jgi:hypothetical protein
LGPGFDASGGEFGFEGVEGRAGGVLVGAVDFGVGAVPGALEDGNLALDADRPVVEGGGARDCRLGRRETDGKRRSSVPLGSEKSQRDTDEFPER